MLMGVNIRLNVSTGQI